MIVLLGPPGSGRTTVLKTVFQSCAASAALPYAWFDPLGDHYTRPWQLAVDLAARLGSTHWRGLGEVGAGRHARLRRPVGGVGRRRPSHRTCAVTAGACP